MRFRAWLVGSSALLLGGGAFGEALYDNTTTDTGLKLTLTGDIWADDIHMTRGGIVDQFQVGFDANGATQLTIRIYDNNASDTFYPGQNSTQIWFQHFVIDPNFSGVLPLDIAPTYLDPDLWFSVDFDHFSAAMWLYDPPETGDSHDVLLKGSSSSWTGSAPRAYFEPGMNNFYLKISGPGVPAPGTVAMVGALGIGAVRRRRRTSRA